MIKKLFIAFFIFSCCQATCKKNTNAVCKEDPVTDCICTQQYDPVCGCDGKTYGNACVAKCAGVKSWNSGECK